MSSAARKPVETPVADTAVDAHDASDLVLPAKPEGTEYATRGARGRRASRPHLRVVSPLRPERASRGVFALVVLGGLAVGMVAILLINTSLAQGAFTISALKAEQGQLLEQEQALIESVAALGAPESLETRARELGMVPSENPVFLDVTTGEVMGKPKPAPGRRSTMPRLLTPADATSAEAVDNGLAGLPVVADPNLDPAAVDAAAVDAATAQAAENQVGEQGAGRKRDRNPNAENNLWQDTVVLDVTDDLASGDAGLEAVPVP